MTTFKDGKTKPHKHFVGRSSFHAHNGGYLYTYRTLAQHATGDQTNKSCCPPRKPATVGTVTSRHVYRKLQKSNMIHPSNDNPLRRSTTEGRSHPRHCRWHSDLLHRSPNPSALAKPLHSPLREALRYFTPPLAWRGFSRYRGAEAVTLPENPRHFLSLFFCAIATTYTRRMTTKRRITENNLFAKIRSDSLLTIQGHSDSWGASSGVPSVG